MDETELDVLHSQQAEDTADAERWRYVRDHLAQMHSPKMNSQHSWRFRPVYRHTGKTVSEAIDKAIEEHENRTKTNDAPGYPGILRVE